MTQRTRLGALVAAGALVAVVALPTSQASAIVVHESNGHFLSVMPHRGVSATQIPGSVAAQHAPALATSAGTVSYQGGPVLHSSDPYLIFWTPSGESIASGTESLLERYFNDVAADSGHLSNVFGVDEQYTDSSGFANYSQSFSSSGQAIVDTHAYPATDTTNCPDVSASYPTCIDDTQLQTEIKRLISADGLPSGTGANAPIYFVVLPTDVNECAPSAKGPQCEDSVFCAYHAAVDNNEPLYAVIPLLGAVLPAGSPYANGKDCQFDGNDNVQDPNSDQVADIAMTYMSHEDNETITDPLATGWYNTTSGNEIGDNCVFYGISADPAAGDSPDSFAPTLGGSASAGTLYDQLINGDSYYTQSEWSNGNNNCELRPTITPSFTAPTAPDAVGSSLTFDPSASGSTFPISTVAWDFGDGSIPVQPNGLASVSHTYSAAGTYTVKLTLVDSQGEQNTTQHSITVYDRPVASLRFLSTTPVVGSPVNFDGTASSDPDQGVTIGAYSWSFGDGATAGGSAPSHTYAAAGTYTVTLTVTNSVGLTNTTSKSVTVDERPTAAFSLGIRKPGTGQRVSFDGRASSVPGGSIVSYAWNFGDSSTGTGARPSHAYKRPGTYTVTLAVVDGSGSMAIVSHTVTIAKAGITAVATTHKTAHGATIVITTNAPGTASAGGRSFRLRNVGIAKLALTLSNGQRLKVKFVPSAGRPSSRTITIHL